MRWVVDNCWWILIAIFAVVVVLSVILVVLSRKDKKIRKDFQEKILIVENTQNEAKAVKEIKSKPSTTAKTAEKKVQKVAVKKSAKEAMLTKQVEKNEVASPIVKEQTKDENRQIKKIWCRYDRFNNVSNYASRY